MPWDGDIINVMYSELQKKQPELFFQPCVRQHSEELISICMTLQLTCYTGNTGSWETQVHSHTEAYFTYSNAKHPLNFPGSLSRPVPTRQTNEDEWLNMKACFKCIMWAFIFALCHVFMPMKGCLSSYLLKTCLIWMRKTSKFFFEWIESVP